MVKNVLIVDDDQEMLFALKEGLEKYSETFSVVLAGDGQAAVEKLKKLTISLVVTDLKMPRMDGFTLLAFIMEHYPDIPVIIITGYSTPEMEKLAKEGGAVGYIAKPFMIDNLAKQILMTLRKEAEGGTLHSVSSGVFLQLMEMEQKTCTIRIVDKTNKKKGVLFFRDGELLDARYNDLQGQTAALEMFQWDDVTLSIENKCSLEENRINNELQPLILEAMRLKDEASEKTLAKKPKDIPDEIEDVEEFIEKDEVPEDPREFIRKRLEEEVGSRSGVEDIYHDDSWEMLISQIKRLGSFFNAGDFKIGYFDQGEANDYFVIPGKKTTIMAVNNKCPRDKIIQAISQ
jgi:CheY-like chemotaxis protein